MKKVFTGMLGYYKREKPDDYIDVFSAFNGFSIYKRDKFIDCKYSIFIDLELFPKGSVEYESMKVRLPILGKNNLFLADCEHRYFHLMGVKKGAKIKICTKSLFQKVLNPRKGLRGPC